MISQYLKAVSDALSGALELLLQLALPLAACLGVAVVAGAVVLAFGREQEWARRVDWRRGVGRVVGYAGAALLVSAGWAVLRTVHPMARQNLQWRESAEATAYPVPDAPPVYQFGPAVAAVSERAFTRQLTLPAEFARRIESDGPGVLGPYLADPYAENVLRHSDTVRRTGQEVVLTREVVRLTEEPIAFTGAQVRVVFRRLAGRAFDAEFEGRYAFENPADAPITARFLFTLPQDGTIRDLNVTVGGQAVPEPNDSGSYEWRGPVQPREKREAVVRYRVVGARAWHYDLGSRRRRVQQFRLDVFPGGPIRFLRGSLQPTSAADRALRWEMSNVVTAQQVALSFPPEIVGRDSYLQALSALPAAFALFLAGMIVLGWRDPRVSGPGRLAGGVALFAFGLATAPVLANYLGPVPGVILCPVVGAAAAAGLFGGRSLFLTVPAALVPAAFLSPLHSGLLIVLLALPPLAWLFYVIALDGSAHHAPGRLQ